MSYFSRIECHNCHNRIDSTMGKCPHCGTPNPDENATKRYDHFIHAGIPTQISLFLVGLAGLQVLGLVISLIAQSVIVASNPGITVQELTDLLKQPGLNLGVNSGVYLTIFVILGLILWKNWIEIGKSFKGWKPYVAGLVGYLAILFFEILYGFLSTAVLKGLGINPGPNANQTGINTMVLAGPFVSFLVFGLVGPFVEEVTYRVGLFSFLSRAGKVVGYIVTAIIFGFIHFAWSSIWSPAYQGQVIAELLNMPPYIFSGVAFCFLYDKFGFAGSYVGHALNNVISIAISLIPKNG